MGVADIRVINSKANTFRYPPLPEAECWTWWTNDLTWSSIDITESFMCISTIVSDLASPKVND